MAGYRTRFDRINRRNKMTTDEYLNHITRGPAKKYRYLFNTDYDSVKAVKYLMDKTGVTILELSTMSNHLAWIVQPQLQPSPIINTVERTLRIELIMDLAHIINILESFLKFGLCGNIILDDLTRNHILRLLNVNAIRNVVFNKSIDDYVNRLKSIIYKGHVDNKRSIQVKKWLEYYCQQYHKIHLFLKNKEDIEKEEMRKDAEYRIIYFESTPATNQQLLRKVLHNNLSYLAYFITHVDEKTNVALYRPTMISPNYMTIEI
jgi:hypothetical protein